MTRSSRPADIARTALEAARKGVYDALIVDTAGRLHVDAELMEEVKDIERAVETHERLFVIDAMAGQDAVNSARAFGAALDLTGVILTKADGDARGGAALSVREVTGKPIVLVGVGEKLDALEPFDAERMAGRILGMGDVVALVEQVQKQVDVDEAQKLARKVAKGKGFDLVDLRSQLEQLQKMGGMASLMDKLPQAAMKGGADGAGTGRQGRAPPDRHHQFHDQEGAAQPGHPRWLTSPAHCRGGGGAGSGRQPPDEAVHGNAEDDEELRGRKTETHDAGLQRRRTPGVSRSLLTFLICQQKGTRRCWQVLGELGLAEARPLSRKSANVPIRAPTRPSTKSLICVESALFFGRPGRHFLPGATGTYKVQ